MCGIYLTISTTTTMMMCPVENGNVHDETTVMTPMAPPDWLRRRGPDAWDIKQIRHYHHDGDNTTTKSSSSIDDDDGNNRNSNNSHYHDNINNQRSVHVRLYASVLRMRDTYVPQPVELYPTNESSSSHVVFLAWNGEVYEYYNVKEQRVEAVYHSHIADTTLVSRLLLEQVDFSSITTTTTTTSCTSILLQQQQAQIATVMGQLTNAEYAFCIVTPHGVFYGRDKFGRRSLLHTSSSTQSPLSIHPYIWKLASVADTASPDSQQYVHFQEVEPGRVHFYPIIRHPYDTCGDIILPPIPIHCTASTMITEVTQHTLPGQPNSNNASLPRFDSTTATRQEFYCQQLLDALLEAVRRRCGIATTHPISNSNDPNSTTALSNAPRPSSTAILFSGGLDSTVIAALALEAGVTELTLLTVSFIDVPTTTTTNAVTHTTAADAIAAEQSYRELCRIYPRATIHFRHSVVDWETVQSVEEQIRTLAHPKTTTVMDVNIATALWFAASTAVVTAGPDKDHPSPDTDVSTHCPSPRILLSGLGADELLGGYGRHRNAYHRGGYDELQQELQLDLDRLWERNLGRDDRILSDTSKEVRFPFLDPNVVRVVQSIPLQYVVDYSLEGGGGDKRILRLVAQQLGLATAASAVKRAIQFGSRISHVSDKRRFGSRRKANAKSRA